MEPSESLELCSGFFGGVQLIAIRPRLSGER
jgi:hypothetical protein